MNENFEAGGVTGELEESEDSDDGEEFEDVGVLHVLEEVLEQHVAVEGQGGHKVDPVERALQECRHRRRHHKTYQNFKRKPENSGVFKDLMS